MLVERHIVAIEMPDDATMTAAVNVAARTAVARATRLERARHSQLARLIGREHAIAGALRATPPLREVQPGLFEQRALRGSADVAREHGQIRDELERSVVRLEEGANICAGVPQLVLFLASR